MTREMAMGDNQIEVTKTVQIRLWFKPTRSLEKIGLILWIYNQARNSGTYNQFDEMSPTWGKCFETECAVVKKLAYECYAAGTVGERLECGGFMNAGESVDLMGEGAKGVGGERDRQDGERELTRQPRVVSRKKRDLIIGNSHGLNTRLRRSSGALQYVLKLEVTPDRHGSGFAEYGLNHGNGQAEWQYDSIERMIQPSGPSSQCSQSKSTQFFGCQLIDPEK
ncbi:hypothetical protein B0H14DRAFT_2588087 [Mycena olivaceomarginata]|nr:hypothetical protein B0H14DRAFT_2588087 [Mycena olivaceomarginata]